jgi:hypothetical protein
VPALASAGLQEDLAQCQNNVWPRFRGYSLSRQQGPDTPRTPDDHYCLAVGYWSGQLDGNRDPAKAAMHAQVAAQQNHAGAQGLLGFLYSRGSGVKQDLAAAVVMWRKAAAQGHADSINALADAYDRGQGVPVDKAEAQRLYRLAAERGSKEARKTLAESSKPPGNRAGQADFDEGAQLYTAKDYAAAARAFLRAAEMGHPRAQLQIGYQYNYGEGVAANPAEAAKWYGRAAAQGDASAQANLGNLYERGRGVREDWVEAARWYQKSADADGTSGEFALGRAYQFGIGVPQNRKLAIYWFQKAGFQGHAQARYFAQHLQSRGNFVGFRDEQEEAQVIAGKLRTGLLWEEPVGMLFHNSAERLAYIRNLRYRVDRYEAYTAWVLRKNEYDDCKRANRSFCTDPGPAP